MNCRTSSELEVDPVITLCTIELTLAVNSDHLDSLVGRRLQLRLV